MGMGGRGQLPCPWSGGQEGERALPLLPTQASSSKPQSPQHTTSHDHPPPLPSLSLFPLPHAHLHNCVLPQLAPRLQLGRNVSTNLAGLGFCTDPPVGGDFNVLTYLEVCRPSPLRCLLKGLKPLLTASPCHHAPAICLLPCSCHKPVWHDAALLHALFWLPERGSSCQVPPQRAPLSLCMTERA